MGAAAVMPPASPMVVSPSAGLAAASLVQQQYLQQAALLAQQHHQQQQQQQQQQYLLQQQQQRQIAVVQPQQQQQLLQTGAGAPAAGTAAVSFMAPLQNVHQSAGLPQHHHQPHQQQQQHQQQLIQSHVPQNNTQNQLAATAAALQPSQPQKQHEKWDPIKEFGLQKDEMALKSPPSNTVAENTRLLKRREEEAAAGRQAYEASESQRVQEELQQQRASAKDAAHALQQRVNSFPEPIHLAGCHTLSKVSKFLPLPVELSSTATALPCFDLQQANQVLANTDESLADYLSTLLSDTTDELRKIELKHGEEESGDLDGIAPVPPMAQTIQAMNSFAFSVDPLDDEQEAMAQAFQNDIQEAVERMNSDAGMAAMAVAMFEAQQQGNHDELFMGTSGSSQQAQHQQQHNRSSAIASSGADGVCGHNIQQQQQSSEQEEEMRRRRQQIVSIGKPGIGGRRKKDMVESLYDSLTGYFDPGSKEKRKRGRKRYNSDGEELEEDMDAAGSPTASNDRCSEEPTDSAAEGGGIDVSATRDPKSRKRARIEDGDKTEAKVAKLATNRPTTPTEVIQQRELEWNERQRQREEKYKRRRQQQQHNNATDGGAPAMDAWTVDIVAEQESFCKFTALVDQVLEQMDEALGGTALSSNMHGDEAAAGLLLDRALLDELRVEAQKLKSWQKLCDVSTDRLVKLLTILEKNIRDVLTENGALSVLVGVKANEEDEMDETLKELIDERVLRSVDASLVALCIMTSKKMPKQLLMEDIIERSVQLSKQCLHDIIYPARDPTLKSMHAGSKSLSSSARKSAFAIEQLNTSIGGRKTAAKNTMVNQLYTRMVDLFTCFSELASAHNLNETLLVQLNSLGCPPFFVDNVPELQMQSIKLLPTIFAKCPVQRKALLFDLINSLHRLPPSRSMRNTYRLSATEHISNFTVLILQLIQSTVQLPTRKHHHHHGGVGAEGRRSRRSSTEGGDDLTDRLVLDSYEEAKRMAAYFLGGFLGKCTARSEDDYRRIFEQFLQDILVALYRPLWPVTELILTVLGNLLVMHFRSKNYDLSLRVASMDYLGVIAARLRKDRVHALSVDASAKEKQRLNAIVRCILFDEHQQHSYDPTATSSSSTVGGRSVDDIDISHLSSSEKVRKLEQALFDYIIWTTWEGDVSMEYVLLFYAVEWYRETVLDVEIVKERYQKAMAQGNAISQKERQKFEQKLTRILEKGASMKTFITALMDKQHLKRRIQVLAKTGNVMVDSDALWVVKYLASKKELSQSFDLYLKKILEGFNPDLYPVAIRAKAMKCLAQIVEADYQVLMISEVNKIVQDRLIDANASVREATFDLIGKCLVSRPELLDTYYSILINRTKDTAVAVRKRVIRILRDIVFSRQDYAHRAQILVELLQRVNDEEGVRKLCLESFQQLWFQPVNMRTEEQKLREKLILMVETAKCCVTDGSIEYFETMICAIAKQQRVGTGQDSAAIFQASKQIVDALVDYVLELEKMVAQEQKKIVAGVTSEEETASSTTTTTATTTAVADAVPLSSQGQMAPPEDAQEVVNRTKHFQSHLFASLTLLSHFARARPEMLIRHIEVFVPYLTIAESSGLEFRVLNQIITMLEQIIPLMDAYSVAPMLIRQLDTRLNEIGRDGGMLLIASSISCMSALYEKFQPQEQPGICRLFMVYFKYLDKLKRELDQAQQQQQQQRADANTAGGAPYELSADKKPMLLRALYSTGLMCRHFDFDALLNDTQRAQLALTCGVHTTSNGTTASSSNSNDATPAVNSNNVVRTAVFSLLFHHSRSADHAISQKALIALGQLSAGHPELLRRDELKSMYMVLLNSDKRHYLQLKVQVLKNIACFLHVEEQKALRRADQAKREREQRARQQREAEEDLLAAAIEAQEDLSAAPGGINVLTPGAGVDDLKEMELSSSGLSSSIIQQYWTAILNCYFHNDEVVRVNAAQVIRQTLEQGLVTPGSSVPTLVAMSTDTLVNVRTRVEVLIRDMNTKYKGMILSKAIPGVRLSFQLQHKIRFDLSQAIRGIRSSENPLNSSAGPSAATTTAAAASSSSSTDKKALSTLPTYANDAQALLGNFYVCIRVNRQQRRSFLSSLLKLFSEDHKEKIDREEWVYVADNLAHFPYTVLDEPLYVIHQANSIISVSGQSILSRFRQLLLPSTSRGDGTTREQQQLQHQLQHVHLQQQQHQQQSPQRPTTRKRYLDLSGRSSNASSMGSSGSSGALLPPEELEEFSVEYIIEHLPSDRTQILELKLNSQACFLLLHLKLFLLRMYGLKEDKIVEYTPSEAAAVYEKACSRRNIRCFAPDFVINELAAASAASTGEQQRNADDWTERRRIAEDFHKFHEMLLSLDERRDDDEDEAAVGVAAMVPPFPCAATVTATVGDQQQQHQQLQQ